MDYISGRRFFRRCMPMIKSDDYQIFHDIINYPDISPKISGFFENLRVSVKNNSATGIINTLNSMLQENEPLRIWVRNKSQKEDLPVDLLTWFEVLCRIFIIKWYMVECDGNPDLKNPVFCTFARTFENPALYPDYWFELPRERKNLKSFIISPVELLTAFDRYMYDSEGGACWEAVDINVDKFVFRCICEPAREREPHEDPCGKIASLILAAHQIVTGRLNLYLSESQEVNLKYAGVKTGDSSLLKYFHYDRFTRYSYIRERERRIDADMTKPYPEFSSQWASMAAMTEFVLQNKGARATKTTCSRVSIGTILKCLNKLSSDSFLQQNAAAVGMLEKGLELLDDENFSLMSTDEVLKQITWENKVISAESYLKLNDLFSAEDFWELATRIFEVFIEKFNDKYYALLRSSSSVNNSEDNSMTIAEDSRRLLQSLEWEQIDELRGRLSGARLREALKSLLVNGDLEFHSGQLWAILQKNYNREPFCFFSPRKGRKIPLLLPYNWVCNDISAKNAPAELDIWARDVLSESTRGRDNEIIWNFSAVDFSEIQKASDKTWEIYFSPAYESAVKSRYIISLLSAQQILRDEKDRYAGVKLVSGAAREELLRYINEELYSLTGGMDIDIEKEKAEFAKLKIYCFADFGPTWQRGIVILDIIARLVVTAAKNEIFAAVWNNIDERIRFITHVLSATHSNLEHPFPYHIGLLGDTVLRISRGTDQRDHLSRLANHEYENPAEQYCFLMALGKYLRMENQPEKILQAIKDNSSLAAFAAPEQLAHLNNYLTEI